MAEIVVRLRNETTEDGNANSNNNAPLNGGGTIPPSVAHKTNKAGQVNQNDKTTQALMVNVGKSILQDSVKQYGNITGDTITQTKLSNAISVSALALMAIKGGTAGMVMAGVSIATQTADAIINNVRERQQIDLLRQRSGNSQLNGSRGTNE